MIVKDKKTGQLGRITGQLDPNLYEKVMDEATDTPTTTQPTTTTTNKGGISEWIPTAGSIVGGIGGGIIGGLPGAVVGSGLGSGAGEYLRQRVTGEDTDIGKVGKEAAWGAGSEIVGGVFTKVGGKILTKVAPDLASKVIGASASQAEKFATKTGKEISEYATEKGLLTRSVKEVDKAIKPVQTAFDELAIRSGQKIPIDSVISDMVEQAANISKQSGSAYKTMGRKLLNEAIDLEKKFGKGSLVDVSELTRARKEFDALVKTFSQDEAKKSVYQLSRDSIQKSIQGAMPDVTVGGKNIKQLGSELRDLYAFKDVVTKTAGKGKGAELLGLGALGRAGTGAGTAVAGSLALGEKDPADIARNALIGAGLSTIASSPRAMSILVKGLSKGGTALTEAASQVAGKNSGKLLTVISQLVGKGAENIFSPETQLPDMETTKLPAGLTMPTPTTVTGAESTGKKILSPGGQWEWSPEQNDWVKVEKGGPTEEDFKQAMIKDWKETGGKNIAKIQAYQKSISTTSGKPMTAGQKKELSDYEVSEQLMTNLIPEIETASKNGLMGPISGRARILNPYDTDVQTFNSNIKAAAQVVGRAMEGGVLRKEDIPKYEAMLPNITDTRSIALGKIKNVTRMLQLQRKTKEITYSESENISDTMPDITQTE